jgi:hypothetical protein
MPRKQASLPQRQDASGIRLKALQGVGQKNPDADHAKKCGNCLDHNSCPLRPRGHKTAWPAEQSKEFPEPQWFRGVTDDFRQQRMSRRRQAPGEDGNTRAESRYNLDEYVSDGREPSRVGTDDRMGAGSTVRQLRNALGKPVEAGQSFILLFEETAIHHAFCGGWLRFGAWCNDRVIAVQPAFRSIIDIQACLELLGDRLRGRAAPRLNLQQRLIPDRRRRALLGKGHRRVKHYNEGKHRSHVVSPSNSARFRATRPKAVAATAAARKRSEVRTHIENGWEPACRNLPPMRFSGRRVAGRRP